MAELQPPHYAEAWSPRADGCFRFVSDAAEGRPAHCPAPPAWRGVFRDGEGRAYMVKACEGHRGGLERSQRVGKRA